jgi:chromosome segregation ATPase
MATNGIDMATENGQAAGPLDRTSLRKRTFDSRGSDTEYPRSGGGTDPQEAEDFALAPLVDKVAYGIARGLVVAVKELEQHIASETRKVGDAVDRRLETLHISLQELTKFVGEQRSTNIAVQAQVEELTAGMREGEARHVAEVNSLRQEAQELSASVTQRIDASTASLQEADARQTTDLEALRAETKAFSSATSERIDAVSTAQQQADARQAGELTALSQSVSERINALCKDLSIHQEDIAAFKTTICTLSSRVDALVERLDRQADAVRSMCAAYSQRETELQQLVDGLARLRAYATPLPTNGL